MLSAVRSVVAFGGGTGLGRLLSALAPLGDRLVGVVTTTDDGGSTGRLRAATGSIAWGDLRNCFNQLCREPTLGRLLFEYRFVDSGELSGHNLGNLMLLALDQLTARPLDAVNLVRDLLEVQPRLLPMSEEPAALVAEAAGGERVAGETAVDALPAPPRRLWLEPAVEAPPEILEAIAGADLILMGPGSFVTSVMPSLLVEPIRASVAAAACPRVLIANLAVEHGPTGALPLKEQLTWMQRILGTTLVDAVLWPSSRPLPHEARPTSASKVRVLVADLATTRGVHHRERLVAALGALLQGAG
jgi:uncharacterized cofD-like protein